MNIMYSSRLISRSFEFGLPTLHLNFGRWLNGLVSAVSGLRISYGWWVNITNDRVEKATDRVETNGQVSETNIYKALVGDHHIRLLALHPKEGDDILRGELLACTIFSHADFSIVPAPPYTALSYCWGEPTFSDAILLGNTPFPITPSLGRCLRTLWAENGEGRMLWVDQICINQDDIGEKSHQVGMMDSIYAEAKCVTVWLGEASEYSDTGMQVLHYFASTHRPSDAAPWRTLPPEVVREGLRDVMSRPWFSRRWVVQEVALSQKTRMICGSSTFSWPSNDVLRVQTFMRMIKYAEILPAWLDRGLSEVSMQPLLMLLDLHVGRQLDRSFGTSHRPAADILDIAYDLRHRLSSDPRDRVFALQGLSKDLNHEPIEPDYKMTLEQVYEHLSRLIDSRWPSAEEFEADMAGRMALWRKK